MIFLKLLEPLGSDFVVYFEAAKMFLAGLNPYVGLITRTFPFNYPPTSLLFLWPLGFLDFNTASILWNILSTVSILVSVWLILKLTKHFSILKFILCSLAFTVFFFPVKFNIGNGQINNFLLLFCSLALYLYQTGQKKTSAFFLALAISIKFAPAVFLLYFFIRQDYRQVKRVIGMLLALIGVSFLFIPASHQAIYFFNVLPMSFTSAAKDWYYNQSLWGFLARSFSNASFISIIFYLLSSLVVFLTWWRGRKINQLRALAAVASLYLILHPIALQHYFGFALIPLILIFDRRDWLAILISYLLLAFDIKNFAAIPKEFNFLLSHDFYGIFALWVLALWREKFWTIMGGIWIAIITISYILMLLCRGNFCP